MPAKTVRRALAVKAKKPMARNAIQGRLRTSKNPLKKTLRMVFVGGLLRHKTTRISPAVARVSKTGYVLSQRTIFTSTNSTRPGSSYPDEQKFTPRRRTLSGFEKPVDHPQYFPGLVKPSAVDWLLKLNHGRQGFDLS